MKGQSSGGTSQSSDAGLDRAQLVEKLPQIFGPRQKPVQKISKVVALAGDASTRRYYRIFAEGGSPSWVLQQSEPWARQETPRHSFLAGQLILSRAGVAVPRVLEVCPEAGWVLMEDLGDQTLQLTPNPELYKEALRMLVEWTVAVRGGSPRFADLEIVAPHFKWAFDFEKLQAEMKHTADHLVSRYFKMEGDKFLTLVEANSQWLSQRPRFFCHRDFHSRNLMVSGQKLFAIDFQDARMGPLTYDLVSLLWDPYVQLSDARRLELYEFWKQQLKKRATEDSCRAALDVLGSGQLELELERMKLQRLLKAAGSYASFLNNKGRTDYLPSIQPALRQSVLALERISELFKTAFSKQDAELLTLLGRFEEKNSSL